MTARCRARNRYYRNRAAKMRTMRYCAWAIYTVL